MWEMHLTQGFGAANAALRFTGEVGGPAAQVVTGSVEQAKLRETGKCVFFVLFLPVFVA